MTDIAAYKVLPREIGDTKAYVSRIRSLLPAWPEDILVEWLHKHNNQIEDYAYLNFERFRFELQLWGKDDIPSAEISKIGEGFTDIEDRIKDSYDWLAHYMWEHGTWNTPIVLLKNVPKQPDYQPKLCSPHHLLEGNRRLAFLNGLRALGRAAPYHQVWLVTLN